MVRNEHGFTLLETMIAMGIMLVAFASILMVESASIESSIKARQMNVVSMLAQNAMIEAELEFQGKPFNEVKEEESGQFDEPYQEYTWTRKIKEIKFPSLNLNAGGGGGESEDGGGGDSDNTRQGETLTKLLTNYLSKAIREVTVTVTWKRGEGQRSYSLSTYWVDLNHEFALSE